MAEGDTILRLARRMEAAMGGREIDGARTPGMRRPDGRSPQELVGRTLDGAESRGKHLLLHFSEGLVLHSHLGMNGGWHLYRIGERWRRSRRAAWIALTADGTEAVNFGGTSMRIVREAELARDRRLVTLGPDILGPELDPGLAVARLRAGGRDTEIGDALLDQTLLAGIGNIFKSEACFISRIDPWRKVGDLSDEELAEVADAARQLMLAAVETGRQPKRVYGRPGRPCPRCRGRISSRGQGDSARITYWCPACQG